MTNQIKNKKLTRHHYFAIGLMVALVASVLSGLIVLPQETLAASYNFTQTDWSSGATTTNASHSTDQNNWASFSTSTNVNVSQTGAFQISTSTVSSSETFTTSTHKDTSSTTANWNTAGGQLEMQCSTCQAQSLTLDSISQNITRATLTKNDTPASGTIIYYLSNDGGTNFATATPGSSLDFSTTGSDLRFKIIITGNATVQDVTVDYGAYLEQDNFNRVDGSLGTMSDGVHTWSVISPTIEIVSNQAQHTSGNPALAIVAESHTETDYYVQADVFNQSQDSGIMGRYTDTDNYYMLRLSNVTLELYKRVAANFGLLGSYSAGVNSGTIKLVMAGNQISGYFNNTLRIGPVTNSELTTGKPGLRGSGLGASGKTWDNFEAGNGTGTATGTITESFTTVTYKDTASTTANWNTSSGQVEMQCSTCQAQSLSLDSTSQNIVSATLTKNDTPASGTVIYYLSNDGGTNFATATAGSALNFSTTGSDLRFKITLTSNATVQDLTVNYSYYNASGTLTSSAYNSNDAANLITALTFNTEASSSIPASTTVQVQIRSAPDSGGSPGTWSNWCGPGQCDNSDYFSATSTSIDAGHPLRAGENDRWFQYRVTLTSPGNVTPVISDVKIQYVVNDPPQFDSTFANNGVSSTQLSDSSNPDWGKIPVAYKIRDTDTTSGSSTPNAVTPSFQYNLGQGGGWQNITSGLNATATDNVTVQETAYLQYKAVWDVKTQVSNTYSTSTQIKVIINDNEPANNTASSTSAVFTLDTKNPSITTATFNSATNTLSLSFSDNTNASYRISNNADFSYDNQNASSNLSWIAVGSTSVNTTSSWTGSSASDYETTYLEVRDSYNNTSSVTIMVPSMPTNISLRDISNLNTNEFWEFISWNVYTATSGAAFSKYEIYRSTNGVDFSVLTNITATSTNYYRDTSLSSSTTYYYRIAYVDTDGDRSNLSAIVSDQPNGQGGTDVTPPTISSVAVSSTQSTWALITWTTDEIANSIIEYGVATSSPGYGSTASSSAYITSHSLVVSGLSPNTNYKFRVKANDFFDNSTTDNNNGSGYPFTTLGGPLITDVSVKSVADQSAAIVWNTNKAADSYVIYSTHPSYLDQGVNLSTVCSVCSPSLVSGPPYQHSVPLTGLSMRTKYYFYVKSTDGSNNSSTDTNGGNYYSLTTSYDTKPPTITTSSVPILTTENAALYWETDELATTQAYYGASSSSLNSYSTEDTTLTISHLVALSGLSNNTAYYYRLYSKDAQNNLATSSVLSFTTPAKEATTTITIIQGVGGGGSPPLPQKDTTPPSISNIAVKNLGAFGVTISFETNEPTYGFVNYGLTKDYGKIGSDQKLSGKHEIILSGLKTGSEYHFQIIAVDRSENLVNSNDQTFTTKFAAQELESLSTTTIENVSSFQESLEALIESTLPSLLPPFIEKPRASNITENSALIGWRTNTSAYSLVAYAEEGDYLAKLNSSSTADNPYTTEISQTSNKTKNHEVVLSSLKPNAKYHFQARSFVLPGVIGKSKDLSFITKAAAIELKVVDINKDSIKISWISPEPTTSFAEYRNTRTNELNRKGEEKLDIAHVLLLDNLSPDTAYEIRAFGYTDKENLIESGSVTARTSRDIAPPIISSIKVDGALIAGRTDLVQLVVTWRTNEQANSVLYYQEGVSGGEQETLKSKLESDELTTNHVLIISKLKAGNVYSLKIVSFDEAGNQSASPVRTIVTPRGGESVVDIIVKNFQESFGFLRGLVR